MNTRKALGIIALCLLFGLLLTVPTEEAHAQFGLEAPKDKELPPVTKAQKALALGSFIAMILVVKYL